MPAFVLAPPFPPVFSVCARSSEGVLWVFSRKTTTALPLALFVLVITSGWRADWPWAAIALVRMSAAGTRPAQRRRSFVRQALFIVISWKFWIEVVPRRELGSDSRQRERVHRRNSLAGPKKLRPNGAIAQNKYLLNSLVFGVTFQRPPSNLVIWRVMACEQADDCWGFARRSGPRSRFKGSHSIECIRAKISRC